MEDLTPRSRKAKEEKEIEFQLAGITKNLLLHANATYEAVENLYLKLKYKHVRFK